MTVDLQAAYLFLLDRHNRGDPAGTPHPKSMQSKFSVRPGATLSEGGADAGRFVEMVARKGRNAA
jgi:hypothetical protein